MVNFIYRSIVAASIFTLLHVIFCRQGAQQLIIACRQNALVECAFIVLGASASYQSWCLLLRCKSQRGKLQSCCTLSRIWRFVNTADIHRIPETCRSPRLPRSIVRSSGIARSVPPLCVVIIPVRVVDVIPIVQQKAHSTIEAENKQQQQILILHFADRINRRGIGLYPYQWDPHAGLIYQWRVQKYLSNIC